jgi:hypothetical protein
MLTLVSIMIVKFLGRLRVVLGNWSAGGMEEVVSFDVLFAIAERFGMYMRLQAGKKNARLRR